MIYCHLAATSWNNRVLSAVRHGYLGEAEQAAEAARRLIAAAGKLLKCPPAKTTVITRNRGMYRACHIASHRQIARHRKLVLPERAGLSGTACEPPAFPGSES
jgi:hypothetical protein